MIIDWKAKIGYGDIISPICYAYNESQKRQEEVTLNFLFEAEKPEKYKDSDPETLSDRIYYIMNRSDRTGSPGVTVEQKFGQNLYQDFQHTNYFDQNISLHNLRFSTESWKDKDFNRHIAVITPRKNRDAFTGNSAWKDPWQGEWGGIISHLKGRNNIVREIHYETPIAEACDILRTCKVALTYHGSAAWLCKWMGVPMIVITGNVGWSETIFPWAVCKSTAIDTDLDRILSTSKLKLVREELKQYLTPDIPLRADLKR